MKRPIFVRLLTDDERQHLEAGLRSADAFVLRRCQIVLTSARGEWAPGIARHLGCNPQTVRNVIVAFNGNGISCLRRGSSVPHTMYPAFAPEQAEQLRALLHQSPRTFGKPTSLWTLDLAAEVCFEQGITATRVTGETVRATLVRMGLRWLRAKGWITSPDPQYARKKGRATA
jgi:transposase